MTRDQIIDAFLIPLAWETVNGDQKVSWPYGVKPALHGEGWIAFHRDDPLLPLENGQRVAHPTEADAIGACEADHRAEAVKTWDIAKIEALVAENARRVQQAQAKPLEWRPRKGFPEDSVAKTPWGQYSVGNIHGEWMWFFEYLQDGYDKTAKGRRVTERGAKAAAEADHRRRIKAALATIRGRT